MTKSPLISLLLLLAICTSLFGQTPAPQSQTPSADDQDVVRITTNLIQLDVTVTDNEGRPIRDLVPEDFEVQDNGTPRAITNFSFVTLGSNRLSATTNNSAAGRNGLPGVPPARIRAEQVRRTIALVVDDIEMSSESVANVRGALTKFVDTAMQPDDLVAITRTTGGIGSLQQFTTDKRLLNAAIARIKAGVRSRGVSSFTPLEGAPVVPPRFKLDLKKGKETLDAMRREVYATGSLGVLSSIVGGMRELPGRKSVVMLSEGFHLFDRKNARIDRTSNAMRDLTDLANRSAVVIYTVDPRGLTYTGLSAADVTAGLNLGQTNEQLQTRQDNLVDSQRELRELAKQTGGFAIQNNNDLSGGLKQVIADQEGYYLIGYHPDEATFDPTTLRYNTVKVTVRRPGVKVRYRSGYYGMDDHDIKPVAPQTTAQALAKAINSPFDTNDVRLRLTALFGNDATNGSFVRLLLHINTHDLTFTETPDGGRQAVFDLLQITFGADGAVVDQVNRNYTISLTADAYRHSLSNGFVYTATIPIARPGSFQIRAALRDIASNRIGSATQFLEVPEIESHRLALSGITLLGVDANGKQPAAVTEPGNSGADSSAPDPLSNAALRRFSPGMLMQYGCIVYNARSAGDSEQLKSQARLFRDGQVVFDGGPQPFVLKAATDAQRLSLNGAIQLGTGLPPGSYVFQVVVIDAAAKANEQTATQSIDFEIVPESGKPD